MNRQYSYDRFNPDAFPADEVNTISLQGQAITSCSWSPVEHDLVDNHC